jgi:hypothetical protein
LSLFVLGDVVVVAVVTTGQITHTANAGRCFRFFRPLSVTKSTTSPLPPQPFAGPTPAPADALTGATGDFESIAVDKRRRFVSAKRRPPPPPAPRFFDAAMLDFVSPAAPLAAVAFPAEWASVLDAPPPLPVPALACAVYCPIPTASFGLFPPASGLADPLAPIPSPTSSAAAAGGGASP